MQTAVLVFVRQNIRKSTQNGNSRYTVSTQNKIMIVSSKEGRRRHADEHTGSPRTHGRAVLERFIEAHEAFVLRCASRHAGFAVTRSDDEYSVALLAFYEAIKGYDPASGPFGAYASLVIGRRLADHYRSQHRFDAETPLAPQTFDGTVDRESADAAMQQAVAEQMSEAKPVSAQDEIEAANTVFEKYGFAFYDLAASSPKSDKTRRSCAAAVGTLLHSPVLFASMQSAHSLPIKALAQQCGVSARTITRHRDYIVAAALLIDGDYPILCTYLQTMRKEAEQCVR